MTLNFKLHKFIGIATQKSVIAIWMVIVTSYDLGNSQLLDFPLHRPQSDESGYDAEDVNEVKVKSELSQSEQSVKASELI